MSIKLLLAEVERSLSRALTAILERNNYSVDTVYDGEEALAYLEVRDYDALILDLMMPKLDGLSVLRRIRARGSQLPVLILTAKSDVEDKVLGLDSGANDYLAKPFASPELLARIRAMTRSRENGEGTRLTVGNTTLNLISFEVSTANGRERLSNKDFQILEMLMRVPGMLIPAERFIEMIWGLNSEAEVTTVRVHISGIRKTLTALESNIQIMSKRNTGYSLEVIL